MTKLKFLAAIVKIFAYCVFNVFEEVKKITSYVLEQAATNFEN